MRKIKFSYSQTCAGRKHFINEDDVRIVLSRLPGELCERLRAVHFNDRAYGRRRLGYVNMGHREIAICALPSRVSLAGFRGEPNDFGAIRGRQWPELAVRRRLLYGTFLHELGHLQMIDPKATRLRRRFASETKAEEFAHYWRRTLWSFPFEHPDPIHSHATQEELERLNQELAGCVSDTSGNS